MAEISSPDFWTAGAVLRGLSSRRIFNFWKTHRTMAKTSNFTRQYKLFGAFTTTASAICSITVPRDGILTSIQWSAYGVAPADATGRELIELSTASVSTANTNDTPGNSISSFAISSSVASVAVARNTFVAGLAQPLVAGDKLYLHVLGGGTAFASGAVACTITVAH